MTEPELQDLIRKYRVPGHIMKHMEKVAEVAAFIGKKLAKKNEKIDLEVLRQAALLHDLMKLCDFKELDLEHFDPNFTYSADDVRFWSALIKSCNLDGHIKAVFNILTELGEDRLAEIIKKHRFTSLIDPDPRERPQTWEEKVLYYADKRVMHYKVVSIKERLDDGRKRYFPHGDLPPDDSLVEKALVKLEKEICEKAGIMPDDIQP
jgi:uncharacterized protein